MRHHGARSIAALVGWKMGSSSANAHTIATVARRLEAFPLCAQGMGEGRLSLDQVGVIAARAGEGSDAHYAQLASVATVNQLRTAVKLEPRPEPEPGPNRSPRSPRPPTNSSPVGGSTLGIWTRRSSTLRWRPIGDALITEWKHDRANSESGADNAPPLPGSIEAFLRLVEAGWDVEAARRPHGQHTTVVVHVDVEQRAAALHLGPLLTDAERQELTCDGTGEVWFERHSEVIGAGRATRLINQRLAARSSSATPPARFPAAGPPAACTPTTSGTGKTAGPPSWPTWCWSAPITTGCTTGA